MLSCKDCGASTGIKKSIRAVKAMWNKRTDIDNTFFKTEGTISIKCPQCGSSLNGKLIIHGKDEFCTDG